MVDMGDPGLLGTNGSGQWGVLQRAKNPPRCYTSSISPFQSAKCVWSVPPPGPPREPSLAGHWARQGRWSSPQQSVFGAGGPRRNSDVARSSLLHHRPQCTQFCPKGMGPLRNFAARDVKGRSLYIHTGYRLSVCMYVCMHACMHAWMHAWMHACMHACMDVCMYVCMYVCMSRKWATYFGTIVESMNPLRKKKLHNMYIAYISLCLYIPKHPYIALYIPIYPYISLYYCKY